MEDAEKKLIEFEKLVLGEARQQRDQIVQEIEQYKHEKILDIEIELLENAYKRIQKEIASIIKAENEKVAKVAASCRKELLTRRENMVERIFSVLNERIAAFKETEAYAAYLLSAVSDGIAQAGGNNPLVCIDKTDMKFAKSIQNATGYEPVAAGENMIGGCKVHNKEKKIICDNSLVTMLEAVKEQFMEEIKISIV